MDQGIAPSEPAGRRAASQDPPRFFVLSMLWLAIDNAIIKPSKPLHVQTVVRPNGQKNDL
jgi:hypothetical protein